jgi:hypothetical protein
MTTPQLDREKLRQVLGYVDHLLENDRLQTNLSDWFDRVEAYQTELKAKCGGHTFAVGSQGLLDELREEASWPRW